MTSHAQGSTSETTRLLEPSNNQDDADVDSLDSAGAPASLDAGTRTLLLGVFTLILLIAFASQVSGFSEIDLVRSIACAEYHTLRGTPTLSHSDCQIDAVDSRYADIMAATASLGYITGCFNALVVFPLVLRRLGHKVALLLGLVILALDRGFYAWLAGSAQYVSGQAKLHPTTALHCILAEAFLVGILGDTLFVMVAQAVVLDTVPAVLRSTWLARFQSCTSIGGLAATVVVQMLNLDTSSDLIVNALPMRIGAAIGLFNIFAGLSVFLHVNSPSKAPLDTNQTAEQTPSPSPSPSPHNTDEGRLRKFKRAVDQACRPLRLLFRPVRDPDRSQRPDWRLSRVLVASFFYGEMAVATNMVLYYSQARFHIHAKESSFLAGWINICAWIYLSFGFQRIARWVRKRTVPAPSAALEQPDASAASQSKFIPAERWLTIGSLVMDIAAWTTFTLAGRAGSFPFFYVATFVLSLSLGGPPSFTSLSSLLLPEGAQTEELLAALFFVNNVASSVGPMLNARVYRLGLHIQTPELIFMFMAALSFVSMLTIVSIRPNPT